MDCYWLKLSSNKRGGGMEKVLNSKSRQVVTIAVHTACPVSEWVNNIHKAPDNMVDELYHHLRSDVLLMWLFAGDRRKVIRYELRVINAVSEIKKLLREVLKDGTSGL